jgi:hypothetical protein
MMRPVRSVALAALLACAGCGRSDAPVERKAVLAGAKASAAKQPHPRLAPRAPRALTAPHLPEDPVLAARTSAATDERRAKKKHKRYLAFDGENMPVHRALLGLITSARERYDRARSEAALKAARTAVPAKLAKLEAGLVTLDSKSVGSRLLEDYKALHEALAGSYPDAKLASLRGDAGALTAAQASFDQRLQAMNAWLHEVEQAKAQQQAALR